MPARRRNNRQQTGVPPIGALTQGSAFLCMSWQFPDQAGAQPTGYSLAWTVAGTTTTVAFGASQRRYDINATSGVLSTPVISTVTTATTGGTIPAGTSAYRVSAMNVAGQETLASVEVTVATTGATSANTVNWAAVAGATGYRIYGRTSGAELLIATVTAALTFTDTGAVTPAGALPSSNTTGPATPTVAIGAAVSCTITATYAGGVTGAVTRASSMVALAAPSPLTTGPRVVMTANTGTGNFNGYNQSTDAAGIVRYTGVDFVNGPVLAGTQGGPTTINGFVFTDCRFNSFSSLGSMTGASGVVLDHCATQEISSALNPVGFANRSILVGNGGSPWQQFRNDTAGNGGSALTPTPWTYNDCAFLCPYPVPPYSLSHYEAIHFRGAKDVQVNRCYLYTGYALNPDGTAAAVTSNIYFEGAYGGNDNIVLNQCWFVGTGPFYAITGEGANISITNGRWSHAGRPGDLQFEGAGKPGMATSLENKGGQGAATPGTLVYTGNVWDVDGAAIGPGVILFFDNSRSTKAWF